MTKDRELELLRKIEALTSERDSLRAALMPFARCINVDSSGYRGHSAASSINDYRLAAELLGLLGPRQPGAAVMSSH